MVFSASQALKTSKLHVPLKIGVEVPNVGALPADEVHLVGVLLVWPQVRPPVQYVEEAREARVNRPLGLKRVTDVPERRTLLPPVTLRDVAIGKPERPAALVARPLRVRVPVLEDEIAAGFQGVERVLERRQSVATVLQHVDHDDQIVAPLITEGPRRTRGRVAHDDAATRS